MAVNYDDFECPFCSRMHQTLFPTLLKEYGDRVVFIYKDFPLAEIHPWATHAAVNANCLAAQNPDAYWDFADYMHANQKEVNSEKSHDGQFAALDRMAMAQGQKHNLDAAKLQACIKAQQDDRIKASVHEGEDSGRGSYSDHVYQRREGGWSASRSMSFELSWTAPWYKRARRRQCILPRPRPTRRSRGANNPETHHGMDRAQYPLAMRRT